MSEFRTISLQQLTQKLMSERPDNVDPSKGYALVNVLSPESHADEHIPQSINIPHGEEGTFEQKFDKDKEIVLYCASPQCDASPKAAETLALRGFSAVADFEGGLSVWKDAGNMTVDGSR
jgi:rhodanese-related sulfurtransferase